VNFADLRNIADAVLYENYVLYPYRASATKNNHPWPFGVIAPREYCEKSRSETWEMQTECLIQPDGATISDSDSLEVVIRFLQLQPGTQQGWDETTERETTISDVCFREMLCDKKTRAFEFEDGISGVALLWLEDCGPCLKLGVRIENLTPWPHGVEMEHSEAMRHSLLGTHTFLGLHGAQFLSMSDPPAEFKTAAALCSNLYTWPVLAGTPGTRNVMLSSPIILPDYPSLAPKSGGEYCRSNEIDELLAVRTMTLTEEDS